MRRVVVVGAGVAGLAGARAALAEAGRAGVEIDISVLEAGERPGGKLWTEALDGVTVEWGPDSFLARKPRGLGLAEEIGLELVPVAPAARRAFLLRDGRLRPLPEGLVMGVPTTVGAARRAARAGLISLRGSARAAIEPLLPGRPIGDPDEPATAVAGRRLGGEAARRLVEPLLRGVFGAAGSEIGVRSAFPQAVGRRSLSRSLRQPAGQRVAPSDAARDDRGAMFATIRGGFGRMVEALVASIPAGALRTATPVTAIRLGEGQRLEVVTDAGANPADAVLIATPAPAAAAALAYVAPAAAKELGGIRYGASAVVVLRYAHDSLIRTLDGSGYLVDPEEGQAVAACSWFSTKWPEMTGDHVVLRAVVTDPRHLAAPDDDLTARVVADVGDAMGAREQPDLVRLRRWEEALPVFAPGHGDRIRSAVAALPGGIALAGAFLGAVGVPDCIASGEEAARMLVARLARSG